MGVARAHLKDLCFASREAPLSFPQVYLLVVLPCAGWAVQVCKMLCPDTHWLRPIGKSNERAEAWSFPRHRDNGLCL